MKDLNAIVLESYDQLLTLPGNYREFSVLLQEVNTTLQKEGLEKINEDQLCEVILQINPKAKFEKEYKLGENLVLAVRINPSSAIRSVPELSNEEKSALREKISSIILSSIPEVNGWYSMAQINPVLKSAGVDYKQYGFSRLKDLLLTLFDEDYKCEERGDSLHPNKLFVLLNVKKYAIEGTVPFSSDAKPSPSATRKSVTGKPKKITAYDKLMNFAFFPNKGEENGFNYAIRQLAEEKVLKENWYYGEPSNDRGTYPILKNYFLLTFERLLAEDEEHSNDPAWTRKILTTERNAVFNTGLVDKLYEPVYALFNRNLNENSPKKWVFWTFVKSNDREHQVLTRIFGTNLPAPAHYYNSTSELVYNIKTEIGSYNWDHFIDHCERLPLDFLRDNGPKFDYSLFKAPRFYKKLAEAIKEDPRSMNRIKNRIIDAIEYAIKRVRWNFKTAIPIYYPGQKQISLLLPLALVDEDNIDAALVLEATDSGAYIAHTILTLEMAYTNARLITRPDSDWLMAEKITANEDEE